MKIAETWNQKFSLKAPTLFNGKVLEPSSSEGRDIYGIWTSCGAWRVFGSAPLTGPHALKTNLRLILDSDCNGQTLSDTIRFDSKNSFQIAARNNQIQGGIPPNLKTRCSKIPGASGLLTLPLISELVEENYQANCFMHNFPRYCHLGLGIISQLNPANGEEHDTSREILKTCSSECWRQGGD